jgi:hypothetical protein
MTWTLIQVTGDYLRNGETNWPNSLAAERVSTLTLAVYVPNTLGSDKHLTTYSRDLPPNGTWSSRKMCIIFFRFLTKNLSLSTFNKNSKHPI